MTSQGGLRFSLATNVLVTSYTRRDNSPIVQLSIQVTDPYGSTSVFRRFDLTKQAFIDDMGDVPWLSTRAEVLLAQYIAKMEASLRDLELSDLQGHPDDARAIHERTVAERDDLIEEKVKLAAERDAARAERDDALNALAEAAVAMKRLGQIIDEWKEFSTISKTVAEKFKKIADAAYQKRGPQ